MVERDEERSGNLEPGVTREPHADIIDLHPLEKQFLEQFSDNPEAVTLNQALALGLAARSGRVAYAIRSTVPWAYGEDSQTDYYELLRAVHSCAPRISFLSQNFDLARAERWAPVYGGLEAFYPEMSESVYCDYFEQVLESQRKFIEDPHSLPDRELQQIRRLSQEVRTVSELIFEQSILAGEDASSLVLPEETDGYLLKEFSDEYYWRHGGAFSALPEAFRWERSYLVHLVTDPQRIDASGK